MDENVARYLEQAAVTCSFLCSLVEVLEFSIKYGWCQSFFPLRIGQLLSMQTCTEKQ